MGATPTRDTFAGLAKHSILTALYTNVDGNTTVIILDARNQRVLMEVVDATGARVSGEGSMDLKLSDTHGQHVSLRETKACDANGATVYTVTLRSAFSTSPIGSDFT